MENKRSAINLAAYIVHKCIEDNRPINNLTLQKILYLIQIEFMMADSIAFDDDFEAWQISPVVPDVYWRYYMFAGMPIRFLPRLKFDMQKYSQEEIEHIDAIVEQKRKMSLGELYSQVTAENGAYRQVYKLDEHRIIPKNLIRYEAQNESNKTLRHLISPLQEMKGEQNIMDVKIIENETEVKIGELAPATLFLAMNDGDVYVKIEERILYERDYDGYDSYNALRLSDATLVYLYNEEIAKVITKKVVLQNQCT